MRVAQYVFRLGVVYWWLRRLLKKKGRELTPVAISLRTRDLSKARPIAAHLAVASDGILRQEGMDVLSPVQACRHWRRCQTVRAPNFREPLK